MKKTSFLTILFTAILAFNSLTLGAPRGSFSSGGSRSSSSSFSAPKSSSGSSSSWGSKPGSWGASKPSAPIAPATKSVSPVSPAKSSFSSSAPSSSTDRALASKTASNANTKSRADIVNDFKQQNAAKYVNKFDKEPTARPAYIPNSYRDTRTGSTYNVTYNSNTGGYGYWNALGVFILIDALSDAANTHANTTNNYYSGNRNHCA
jgi:hypothetical protein